MKTTTWIKTAATFQILTGLIHSVGLFVTPEPKNETERQLIELMDTYRIDAGAGFTPSTSELFLALSSCMTLLCLFGGILNWYLVKKLDAATMKGVLNINILIFGACFIIMAALTFLPPIICTGLIFVSLLAARLSYSKTAS
jgi:hypothetical protein